jgi:hypothetical protein
MGVDPLELAYFSVAAHKCKKLTRRLTNEEHAEKMQEQMLPLGSPLMGRLGGFQGSPAPANQSARKLWDAKEVDEDSFEKDGIVYAVG